MSFRRILTSLVAVGTLAAWACVVSRAPAEEKQHPIAAQVKAALKDSNAPFTLVIRFNLKEGAGAKFEAAFAKAAPATRQEKGNRAYDLNRDIRTPTKYVLYERWQDLAALEAHLKTPIITKLLAESAELQDGPPEISVLVPAGE